MDFAFELDGRPIVIPRKQHFDSDAAEAGYDTTYGFVGAGRNLGHYILVDGVNEKGLSAAALYFSGEATYAKTAKTNRVNLAPHEVLNWLLGNASDCEDLGRKVDQLNIIDAPVKILGKATPLHWIISDRSGACYVLEMLADGIHYQKNPVGVMTNSPDFGWHLKNLSNYTELKPSPHPARSYNGYEITSFGPGSGALGMPGDYTSVSRFIRTVFMREYADQVPTDQTVNELSHILNSVEIPKGVKLKQDGSEDYTQYRGYMDMKNCAYYMQPYDNQTIYKVSLSEELLNKKAPSEFPIKHQQVYETLR